MTNSAEEYRNQAESCRQTAMRAQSDANKTYWLKLAEDWEKLAQSAEQQKE